MRCAESLRVQAYFDAEVDAVSAADIERHLEHCAECRALLQDLEQVRTVLRRDSDYARTPPELRAKIMRALDQEDAAEAPVAAGAPAQAGTPLPRETPRPTGTPRSSGRISSNWRTRPFRAGDLGGAAGTALAAAFAFLLLTPRLTNPLLDELVSAHVRSLMPSHLIDVVSTDKHTVKPWFTGHADVSPAVADFEPQGYRLVRGPGGFFGYQSPALVGFQQGAQFINIFTWARPARAFPAHPHPHAHTIP